jgi:hypothetical protein
MAASLLMLFVLYLLGRHPGELLTGAMILLSDEGRNLLTLEASSYSATRERTGVNETGLAQMKEVVGGKTRRESR